MSYDINLKDPITHETIQFKEPHEYTGGTYEVGGTNYAWINITYNYSKYYYSVIDADKGIRSLYGKTGSECLPILKKAIKKLGTETSGDYWEATPGNAGHALLALVYFAEQRPDGVFDGD